MRYRLEFLDPAGMPVWIQVGTVHDAGNWTFDIDAIRREIQHAEIARVRIYWGAEADR